jgi:hypothetical protein
MSRLLLIGGTLLACLASTAYAQTTSNDWRFSLEGSWLYGKVDGYVQTPSGGEPGTTSNKQPTLSEIGIDNASIYDAQFIGAYHNEEFYLGGQYIHMSGSSTLDSSLITNGVSFPAGADVNSNVDMNWYRFGYRHRFELGNEKEWTLTPSVGGAVLDFSYKLKSSAESASRSYVQMNAQFGLETEWRPGRGRFSVDLRLLGTVPVSPPLAQMFVEELIAKYRIIENEKCDLALFGGIAFEQIYYEDDQTVPNHIQADFGPMLTLGVNFSF